MIRIAAIIAILIFGIDFFTNLEQPKEDKSVTYSASSNNNDYKTLVPTIKPTPSQSVVVEQTAKSSGETRSNNSVPGPVAVSAPPPAPESTQDRLNRIAASLGTSIPVVEGSCSYPGIDPSNIRGCYTPGSGVIYITQYATMYDDNFVRCVMKHEVRHVWQETNGLYQYENGEIINRDALEADARSYSGC